MRLARFLADCNVASSRRKAEDVIKSGEVTINGQTVADISVEIDVENDSVKVSGRRVRRKKKYRYMLLNKPPGYLTTLSDPRSRNTIAHILGHHGLGLKPAGRLDCNTGGLLVVTDDGMLIERVTSPRFKIKKTYHVKVRGFLTDKEKEKVETGMKVANTRYKPCSVKIFSRDQTKTKLEVVLEEGKNRQVRKIFEAVRHSVIRLTRVKIGEITIDSLNPGGFRLLTAHEIEYLKRL